MSKDNTQEEHSPIFETMKALEDAGLQVCVAYHTKRGEMYANPIDRIQKLDRWSREAFDQGSEWVSVVVVSSPPDSVKNPRLTR